MDRWNKDVPMWVSHARKFILSEDIEHLEAAIAECKDPAIVACLRHPRMAKGLLSHGFFSDICDELRAHDRRQEATALILLALRGPAVFADQFQGQDTKMQRDAFDHCVWLTDVSHKEDFDDCEAYFATKAGYLAAQLSGESGKSLDLYQRAAKVFRKLAHTQPCEYLGWLATVLNNLGGLYRDHAQLEEARRAYRDALTAYRDLQALDAQAECPHYVSILCNLGAVLRELHLYHSALAIYEEALAISGRLASELPESYQEDLAKVHNNLGFLLFHMGKLKEAQENYAKAIALREELVATNKRHASALELTRENMAELEEQLRTLQKRYGDPEWCLHVRRSVASNKPADLEKAIDACHDPDLRGLLEKVKTGQLGLPGQVLGDWVTKLREQGREIEAAVITVLMARYGTFVLQALSGGPREEDGPSNVDACDYLIHLCHAYGFMECEAFFLGVKGIYAGRTRDATQVLGLFYRELRLYRMMSVREPDLWRERTAAALSDIASALIMRQEPGEACAVIREAIPIYEQLIAEGPQSPFRTLLLHAFITEGRALTAQHKYSQAFAAFEVAEKASSSLTDGEGPLYCREYAQLFVDKGVLFANTRQFVAAQETFEQAVSSYDRLIGDEALAHRGKLVAALNNLGNVLAERRLLQDAIEPYTRAATILDGLPDDQREIHLQEIGTVQNNLGTTYWELKLLPEAKEACERAIAVRRRVASRDGPSFEGDVATSLMNLGLVCDDLGEYTSGERHYAEALDTRRRLMGSSDICRDINAAAILHNMAGLAQNTGNTERALEFSSKAVRTAEASGEDSRDLYLAKGKVAASYRRLLIQSMETDDADRTFRCLAAVREGCVRLFDDRPETGLAPALASLEAASAKSGRTISPVLAEDLGDDDVLLAVLMSPNHAGFRLVRETCRPFREKADRLWAAVLSVFNDFDCSADGVTWDEIARLGREAWLSLPEPVRETLHPTSDSDILISGNPRWAAFPWEALRHGNDANDSLGLSRTLARWSPITASAFQGLGPNKLGGGSANASVLSAWDAVASARLPNAKIECESVARLLSAKGFTLFPGESHITGAGVTTIEFEEALSRRPSVIHYCGHGSVIGNEEVLLLRGESAEGRPHGRKEITDLKALMRTSLPLLHWNPVVVLNSCFTGRTRSFGGQREDLAWTFLQEGAEAVIASSFPVCDPVGRMFSEHLYALACESRHMGDAFRIARALVAEAWRDTPYHTTWSLFAYHGNPYATLLPPV